MNTNWIEPGKSSIKHEYDVEYQHHLKHSVGNIFPTFEHFHKAITDAPIVTIDLAWCN